MPKKSARRTALADPSRLPSFDINRQSTIQVIIETPKGSRNKYAFDPEQKVFQLKKVLPAGMAFPYDFGFIPLTLAGAASLHLSPDPALPETARLSRGGRRFRRGGQSHQSGSGFCRGAQ
jgi:inorganic pyrophosphatase